MDKHIKWHKGHITREQREELLGQRGIVVWFTGLSGSGKSTLAVAVEKALHESGLLTFRLDGDNIRHGLNSDLGFSSQDRDENIRRVSEVAALMADAGIITLASFISPFKKARDYARTRVPEGRFIEVYVKASLDICRQRDPKGLYTKAENGEIEEFTGISSPYEEPLSPEIVIDTENMTIDEGAELITGNIISLSDKK
ncbi:MAG: adenylyl-sulfate kinase [candidate division WOR-3 bacterium]|nr:adenylyl-sulfate kinase [candidate division WOR-3 bacterium]